MDQIFTPINLKNLKLNLVLLLFKMLIVAVHHCNNSYEKVPVELWKRERKTILAVHLVVDGGVHWLFSPDS